jgi:hypothetical protein
VSAGTEEPEGTVTPERFRRQLAFLEAQCRIVLLSEAVESLRGERPLPEDLAVITFDDGTLGNYEAAWPVLKEEREDAVVARGSERTVEQRIDGEREALTRLIRHLGRCLIDLHEGLVEVRIAWACPTP